MGAAQPALVRKALAVVISDSAIGQNCIAENNTLIFTAGTQIFVEQDNLAMSEIDPSEIGLTRRRLTKTSSIEIGFGQIGLTQTSMRADCFEKILLGLH